MKIRVFEYEREDVYEYSTGKVYCHRSKKTGKMLMIKQLESDNVLCVGECIQIEDERYNIKNVVHNLGISIDYYIDRGNKSPNIIKEVGTDLLNKVKKYNENIEIYKDRHLCDKIVNDIEVRSRTIEKYCMSIEKTKLFNEHGFYFDMGFSYWGGHSASLVEYETISIPDEFYELGISYNMFIKLAICYKILKTGAPIESRRYKYEIEGLEKCGIKLYARAEKYVSLEKIEPIPDKSKPTIYQRLLNKTRGRN